MYGFRWRSIMPSNNGRDELPQWKDLWKGIDDAVHKVTGKLRVSQKVFPTPKWTGRNNVPSDVIDRKTMTIQEGRTRPYLEVAVKFKLTNSQVDSEATLGEGKTLASFAAKSLAQAEDLLFLRGYRASKELLDEAGVTVSNVDQGAEIGLLDEAEKDEVVQVPPAGTKDPIYGDETFKAVVRGIAILTTKGHAGPYALILEPSLFADTYGLPPNSQSTTAERLKPLLDGGFYMSLAVPLYRG